MCVGARGGANIISVFFLGAKAPGKSGQGVEDCWEQQTVPPKRRKALWENPRRIPWD